VVGYFAGKEVIEETFLRSRANLDTAIEAMANPSAVTTHKQVDGRTLSAKETEHKLELWLGSDRIHRESH
jgi:hypothetical protein